MSLFYEQINDDDDDDDDYTRKRRNIVSGSRPSLRYCYRRESNNAINGITAMENDRSMTAALTAAAAAAVPGVCMRACMWPVVV